MEKNPGRAPFNADEDYTPMRKPHASVSAAATPTRLSPLAQEFVPQAIGNAASSDTIASSPDLSVPKSFLQKRIEINQRPNQFAATTLSATTTTTTTPQYYQNGNSAVQNRLKVFSAGDSDQNFNNIQQQQQSNMMASPPMDVEVIALNYLETVIQCLNENPGSFDTVGTRFLTIFEGMENNKYVLSNAMEDIFNESIVNPNFRYMGAKLYNLLHMLNLREDSLFHTLLKCKLDYHQSEVIEFIKTSQQKVRETALFLAELYMQLRGDDSRIRLIAENIVFSLKQLLLTDCPENIRCICLTLKLAGYDLDSDCPDDVEFIIKELSAINCRNPGKYPLAANVISLQRNNWGRTVSRSASLEQMSPAAAHPKRNESLRRSNEPIFYGPDGQILTEEESTFLSENGGTLLSTDNEDGEDLVYSDVDYDPEMDEETERAYRAFCKLTTTTTNNV